MPLRVAFKKGTVIFVRHLTSVSSLDIFLTLMHLKSLEECLPTRIDVRGKSFEINNLSHLVKQNASLM
jgi:hypothetical protein